MMRVFWTTDFDGVRWTAGACAITVGRTPEEAQAQLKIALEDVGLKHESMDKGWPKLTELDVWRPGAVVVLDGEY